MASGGLNFLIILSVSALLLVLFAILRNRLTKHLLIFSAIIIVAFMYTDIKISNLPSVPNEPCIISGRVTEITNENDKSTLRLKTGTFGNVRLTVYGKSDFIYGDIIRAEAQLFDVSSSHRSGFSRHLMSHRIYVYATADAENVIITGNRTSRFNIFDIAAQVRSNINKTFSTYLPDSVSAMASALLLGDRSGLDAATEEIFRISGITHIVAVSGSHLSMLLTMAMALFGFMHIKRRTPVIIFYLALIWFFVLITGCSFSVIRAAVMCTLVFTAFLIRREADPLSSLAFSVLLLALVNPFAIFDIGLQLSVLSTASIIIFAPLLNNRLPVFSPLKELITTTLTAQIGVLPLSALYFSDISLVAPITNIFAIPLSSFAMTLCIIVCLFSFIPFIAGGASVVLTAVLYAFKFIATCIAAIPFASVTSVYPHFEVCLFYAGLCLALYFMLNRQKLQAFCTFSLSSCVFCVIIIINVLFSPPQLHFIDVGNGDAVLAEDTGVSIMFDGGGSKNYDISQNTLTPFLLKQNIRKIDAVFLTHYHTDHAHTCLSLMEEGYVDSLVLSGHTSDKEQQKVLDSLLSSAQANSVNVITVDTGDSLSLGPFSVEVLMVSEENTLYRLCCGNVTSLITGDMTSEEELLLVNDGTNLSCDILKISHHGSDTSSTEEFIDEANPHTAVISVGRNNYGHPSKDVLDRLYERGIKVYRTDLQGNISFNLNKEF